MERRLPPSLFSPNRIETRLFNGYADQVGHLYSNMDLKKVLLMRAAHYVIWNSLVVWNSLFLLGLSPLLYLGWGIATGQLGPDPGKELVLFLGI